MRVFLVVAALLATLAFSATIVNPVQDIMVPLQDDKVYLQLYYETLCPFCHRFFRSQLKPLLEQPGIWDIVDIRLIPFGLGNVSKSGKNYEFSCHHGLPECQGNLLDTCALNLYNTKEKGIPFVICMGMGQQNWNIEQNFDQGSGPRCAKQFGLDWDQLKSCTNSYYGREWLFENVLKTKQMGITAVPHLMINGEYDQQQGLQYLEELVCRNYMGLKPKDFCRKYFDQP